MTRQSSEVGRLRKRLRAIILQLQILRCSQSSFRANFLENSDFAYDRQISSYTAKEGTMVWGSIQFDFR